MLAPPSPDLAGEAAAVLGRRGSDHLHCRRHAHGVGLAFHAHDRKRPLLIALRTTGFGVELPGAPAQAQPLKDHSQLRVAGPAVPDQISRAEVFFVAINVAYLDIAGGATQGTDPWPRRPALRRIGTVMEPPVSDRRFLAPSGTTGRASLETWRRAGRAQ